MANLILKNNNKIILIFSLIYLFSSCSISSQYKQENNKLELRKREAGRPQIIKEKISKDKYDKVIDKGISILNDTIQIPEGVKNKEDHENARTEFKNQMNKLKEVDGKNQYLIKYGSFILQKAWLLNVKNSLNRSYAYKKYDSNFNLNNHLKKIAENDEKWNNFVDKHLRIGFDLLVQNQIS